LDYLVDYEPNLIILNFFYDVGQPYSCLDWGAVANNRLPLIVNDGVFGDGTGIGDGLDKLFINDGTAPKHIFIDKDLKLRFKTSGDLALGEKISKIKEMLEEIEGD
jgi:hypothetical protein